VAREWYKKPGTSRTETTRRFLNITRIYFRDGIEVNCTPCYALQKRAMRHAALCRKKLAGFWFAGAPLKMKADLRSRTAENLRTNLGHNTGTCAPSWMTGPKRPLFWIASLIRRRASAHPALASDARYAAGRPARTTAGLAPAAMSGIRSIREECAPSAFTGGLQRSVSLAPAGRRIPIGMCSDDD